MCSAFRLYYRFQYPPYLLVEFASTPLFVFINHIKLPVFSPMFASFAYHPSSSETGTSLRVMLC